METKRILLKMEEILEEIKTLQKKVDNLERRKKPKSVDSISEEIDRDLILSKKEVTKEQLEETILRAKEWMLTASKSKVGDYTLRTARVLKFLDNYQNKNEKRKPPREL